MGSLSYSHAYKYSFRTPIDSRHCTVTTIYPSKDVLAKAEFQEDVGDEALQVYQQYWDKLKTGR